MSENGPSLNEAWLVWTKYDTYWVCTVCTTESVAQSHYEKESRVYQEVVKQHWVRSDSWPRFKYAAWEKLQRRMSDPEVDE